MGAELKHGYDGNAPEFRSARGSQVIDPKTGSVTRESTDSPQNIAVDRLEWLLAHKRIALHQHAAGRKLQGDFETAMLVSYGSLVAIPSGGGTQRPSDAKIDAMERVNKARGHMGPLPWRILELVCIEGFSAEKAAAKLHRHPSSGVPSLCDALDTLARHYGFA